jgi:hypothetical protein
VKSHTPNQCNTKENKALWQEFKSNWASSSGDSVMSEHVQDVILPLFVRALPAVKYDDFAAKVEKTNPNVEFDKERMDEIFKGLF